VDKNRASISKKKKNYKYMHLHFKMDLDSSFIKSAQRFVNIVSTSNFSRVFGTFQAAIRSAGLVQSNAHSTLALLLVQQHVVLIRKRPGRALDERESVYEDQARVLRLLIEALPGLQGIIAIILTELMETRSCLISKQIAFLMGSHHRLGQDSPIRCLPHGS
jgi:hypothetical protein